MSNKNTYDSHRGISKRSERCIPRTNIVYGSVVDTWFRGPVSENMRY